MHETIGELVTTLERILAMALLAVSALLYFEYGKVDRLGSQLKEEQATSAALRKSVVATEAALNTKSKALTALQSKQSKTQGELDAALNANREWADGRVPDAVFDRLFDN